MYNQLFLLPSSKDELLKTGVILYLMGLLVTIFYYFSFDILSINFLKPQAIVIGVYIWLLYILIPRIILLLISESRLLSVNIITTSVFFNLMLLLVFVIITTSFYGWSLSHFWFTLMNLLTLNIYYFELKKRKFTINPGLLRTVFFLPFICFLFAYSIYSVVPNHLCGGQPVKVTVVTKDSSLLTSRFSKSIYILYESENEFYFFEKLGLDKSTIVFDYKIKRVPKTEIKKIEYTKTLFQPF